MSNVLLILLSVGVGLLVVMQGGLNARLGILLNSPLLATAVALSMSALITLVAVGLTVRQYPGWQQLRSVPLYLWFSGAAMSFIAVTLFYYLIPRLGISTAVAFGLCGQLLFSTIAGHFGWFGLPQEPLSSSKVIGLFAMLGGLALIKLYP